MTLDEQKKLAAHLQRLLKVRNVSFPIANTEKGPLSIKYIKDQAGYEIVLDAVPLSQSDYDNRELKLMLEKYLFEDEVVQWTTDKDTSISFTASLSGEEQKPRDQGMRLDKKPKKLKN